MTQFQPWVISKISTTECSYLFVTIAMLQYYSAGFALCTWILKSKMHIIGVGWSTKYHEVCTSSTLSINEMRWVHSEASWRTNHKNVYWRKKKLQTHNKENAMTSAHKSNAVQRIVRASVQCKYKRAPKLGHKCNRECNDTSRVMRREQRVQHKLSIIAVAQMHKISVAQMHNI